MAFVDMNNLNSMKNTVYIHGTNDKIASAYLGAIDNTPRYNDSTFDYRVYLTKSLAQTTSLDESLFSLEYLYRTTIDQILTDTFKIDVLFDNNRSIKDIYTDISKVYANNAIGLFDLSTCFYTTPLAKQLPSFTTIEKETLDNFYKNNEHFANITTDEELFDECISNIENIDKLNNIDEFYDYIKTNYLKYYKINKTINTIYFNIINSLKSLFINNTDSYLTFFNFTTKFGITSDKYNASKIVDLYNHISDMQKLISFTVSNHSEIEKGMEMIDDVNKKFPCLDKKLISKDSDYKDDVLLKLFSINDNIIIGSNNSGLYYSEDNGKTWNQSNINTGCFNCLTTINDIVIVGSNSDNGLYYSEDNGKTWNQSNITSGDFECLTVIGNTAIAGSWSDRGLYYSEDNGKTWIQSNITSGDSKCLTVIGSTVIAGRGFNKGLYYSEDNGKIWKYSNINDGYFHCLTVIGNTAIAGGYSYNGLFYSEDNGKTWNQSNINTDDFVCLITIGNTIIAGSWSSNGLYYSEDNGHTWNQSNITSGNFSCLTVVGSTVIANSSNNGLYYSEDNGHTWKKENETNNLTIYSLIHHNDKILFSGKCTENKIIYNKFDCELVPYELNINFDIIPRLYNVLWSIIDTRLSKISSIKENTEMYNYFSKELITNNITEELNNHMILGKDIINPLLESSINGSLSEDENYVDKVYSLLTENYCKIKTLINSLNKNDVKLETLKNNNEFIIYLYISVLILMTLSVISSNSSKNKVFEVVDFDTIMQVLRIDYKKVYTETDILDFINNELNK